MRGELLQRVFPIKSELHSLCAAYAPLAALFSFLCSVARIAWCTAGCSRVDEAHNLALQKASRNHFAGCETIRC